MTAADAAKRFAGADRVRSARATTRTSGSRPRNDAARPSQVVRAGPRLDAVAASPRCYLLSNPNQKNTKHVRHS